MNILETTGNLGSDTATHDIKKEKTEIKRKKKLWEMLPGP